MNEILKPWYAISTPHKDIREGRLDEAVFAANIWAVVRGTAPEVYLDPEEFFRKSYMTQGLATVLKRVSQALLGDTDSGDRIISLQTAFGGGKTHSLVALWHLAKHGERLKKSPYANELHKHLGDKFPDKVKGIAVFTNETCDSTQGRTTEEGIHTRTLWGELAVQLGGLSLYKIISANDESQRVPQGIFIEVLRQASPCLILLDELADYCVGAAAVQVGDTTLADQTISFIQQLTEAVHQVPGAVVIATLPASKYEVAQSEKGQEAFVTLERRFQRLGSDIKPVGDDEIYDVVRARLFETITSENEPTYPSKVALVYHEMYSSHSNEILPEVTKHSYREQIERSYPFHPLLIDALYTRWGSHPDFQRTRGVLRILASIVADLWQRRQGNTQTQHLIQPSHIRWSIDALQAALSRYWSPAYQSVAAADIIGEKSNAGIFDDERGTEYKNESIAQGLASAILLGSFGGQSEKSGFSSKDLKLACSRYGINWNYLDGALLELENRCFYLHTTIAGNLGKRYWFGTKPTLNRLVIQYRQMLASENFNEEIVDILRTESEKSQKEVREASWRIIVDPTTELPEQKSLTLGIIHPSYAWQDNGGSKDTIIKFVKEISSICGGKERLFRNTLVFLAGTSRGLSRLRQNFREKSALENIKNDYFEQLDNEQKDNLKNRLDTAKKTILEAIGPAFTVVLRIHGQDTEEYILNDAKRSFTDHLGYIWKVLVEDQEWILRRVGSVTLQKNGLIPQEGAIRLKDAVESFLRFTDKPQIASKEAVVLGLSQACLDGLIGIGRGASPSSLHARYCKEDVLIDVNEEGIWVIPAFEIPQKDQSSNQKIIHEETTPSFKEPQLTVSYEGEKYQSKSFLIHGNIPVENWGELFRCFINPAVRMEIKPKLGVFFEMKIGDNMDSNEISKLLKKMEEAAHQLGLSFDVKTD